MEILLTYTQRKDAKDAKDAEESKKGNDELWYLVWRATNRHRASIILK